MKLSKIEILKEIMKGEVVEPTPHAVWKHFPKDDLDAERLAKKQLEYLEKFDSLVLKLSPNGRYCVVDWGCEIAFDENKMTGSAFCTSYRVKGMNDWTTLEELDVTEGMFGEQLRAIKLTAEGMKEPTPFVATVFNPLMVAAKLTEDRKPLLDALKKEPEKLHEGLKVITKVMKEFSKAAVDYGAAGIFLATQEACYDVLTEKEYKEFALQYDKQILDAIQSKTDFNIVHIHGHNIMFKLIAKNYPVQAINWHDQTTAPTIAEAAKIFDGVLMGGIEESEFLLKATTEEIEAAIEQTVNSVNGKKLIISPGCVIPINVPDEKVHTVISTLQKKSK